MRSPPIRSDDLRRLAHADMVFALSRFGKSLAVAGALHGALLLTRALTPPTSPVVSGQAAPLFEIEFERGSHVVTNAPGATAVASESMATLNAGAIAQPQHRGRAMSPINTVASAALESPVVALLEGSDAAPVSAPPPTSKIDFGLDGRLFREIPPEAPSITRPKRKSRAELEQALNGSLRDSLKADDVERGYAIGNALVGSLTSAVRNAGPAEGNALISVTINSAGEVSELKLLRGDPGDWSVAMQAFRRQAKQRVALPAGAQGLRITYDVSSKIQLPSGKRIDAAALRLKRPSLAPNGLTLRGDFDVADLSGKTSQMVSARIVREELL